MPISPVSPDLQRERDIQGARIMQAEAQNPVDEEAVAKDLGSVPYNIQVAAQTKETTPWEKATQETAPWAKTSSDKGSSDTAPWEKPKKEEGFWSEIRKNAAGGLAAAGDFIGAIPGSVAAGLSVFAPPENEQTGDTLQQVGERAKKAMESTMPSTYFPEIKENRGYQAASDLLAKPIEYGTKGIRGAAMLPYMTGIAPWLLDKTGIAESPTGNYLEEGQKFASEYLNDKPEMAPGLSATSDILGMVAGYGALGMRPKGETPLPEYGRTGREPGIESDPRLRPAPMGAEPTLGTVPDVSVGGGGLGGRDPRYMQDVGELPQGLAGKEPGWSSTPIDLTQEGKVEPVVRRSQEEIDMERLKNALDRKDIFEKRTNTNPTEPLAFGDENRIQWEPTEIERPNPEAVTGESPTEISQFVQAGENIGDRRGITNTPMQSIDPRSPDYNPNLLQEPPRTHDTLDILTPMLEERGVPIEKANKNKTLKSLTGRLDESSNYIETLLDDKKPIPEIQKAIREWEDLADRTATKAEEISRKAESGQKKESTLNPTRPGSPFKGPGKNQAGGINPEIFRDALDRIKRGWAAMMEIHPPKLGEPEEGGGTMIARGITEARRSPTPEVFYSNREINKGPGGKQSGAMKPEVFLEGIRKGTKSVEEFTKKLVDELGEEFRPLASSLYNKREEQPQVRPELPPSNSKSNLPKSIQKHLIGDTRTAEQFAKEEKANGFGENINPYTKGTELLPLSYIAARSKESPTINWMYTKLTGLDDSLGIKKDMAKNGEKFAPNWRGSFEHHVKSDDGAMTVLNRLSKKDRTHAMDTFFDKFEGKEGIVDEKALLSAGLNKTQAKGILAARTWLDRFAKEFNEDAKAAGEPEIKFLPNYMPHVWRGKFKILVKEKSIGPKGGNREDLVHVLSAETSGEARTMAEEMRKEHPEYIFEEPKINRGKYDTGSIQAYKEAKEFLDKGSPEAVLLDKTFNEILARRGFRKATLNRSGVGGYDTDAGIIGDYLDKGYNFLYNQKKRRAYSELMKAMQVEGFDLAKEHPDTHGYLLDVLNQSVHGLEDGLPQITHIAESVGMAMDKISGGKVGNPDTVSDTIRSMNGLASASFLGTPFFVMVQPLQLLFLIPKAIQLKLASRAPEASFMSLKQSIYPDDYAKEAMSWAVRNGKIQSKAMELLDLKAGNPRTWAGKAPIWYTNNVLGKADSSLTRIPAFFFFDSLLKNEIPDKQDRWFKAALLGNDTMVNYSHTNRPLALGRMGDVVGPALRPFTQFPISYAGQILSYLKDTKTVHGGAAVAAFLAMQYIQGGLNGMVGIQDANKVIEAINDTFKTDIDTPERLLATQDWAGNSVRYGPFATLTGLNYSSTTAAPTILNPPAVPGLSMASNLVQGAYHGVKAMTPEGTEADKMQAAIKLAPKIFHSGIEKYFTKEGMGTPNPAHNMDTDTGPRTDKDWTARFLGSRSPEEATEKMRIGAAKKEIQFFAKRRGELVDVMIDRLAESKEIDDSIKDKYIKYDGNPDLLAKELVNGLIDRNKKWAYRYLGNIQGLNGAQKAQRLKEFNLLIQNEPLEKQIETLKELNNAR